MNDSQQSNIPNLNLLLLMFLSTVAATVVTTITAMMMALGTGLASSPEEPVRRASQVLWAIGGLSFLPIAALMVTLIGSHKRNVGVALALTVIVAGLMTALGWFVDSGGDMPGTTGGNVLVILVVVIPLLAGAIIFWQSAKLKA